MGGARPPRLVTVGVYGFTAQTFLDTLIAARMEVQHGMSITHLRPE